MPSLSEIANPVNPDVYGKAARRAAAATPPPSTDTPPSAPIDSKAPLEEQAETLRTAILKERVARLKDSYKRERDMRNEMAVGSENYNAVKNFISSQSQLHRRKGLSPAAAHAAAMADAETKFGASFMSEASRGAGLPGGPGSISSPPPRRSISAATSRAAEKASAYRSGEPISSPTPPADLTFQEFMREISHADAQKLVDKTSKTNPALAKRIFDLGKGLGYSMTKPGAPSPYPRPVTMQRDAEFLPSPYPASTEFDDMLLR